MSQSNIKLPPGLYLSAVATQNFEVIDGVSQKGRRYSKIVGRGVAGERFVKVTQFVEDGEQPLKFAPGEAFQAEITGVDTFEKGREVVSLFVKLQRPATATVEVKR
jgi:hypothetical protein